MDNLCEQRVEPLANVETVLPSSDPLEEHAQVQPSGTAERVDAPAIGAAGRGACAPLVVDLDDTLVATDLLLESVLMLLRNQPLCVFRFPLWMLRGKATFKHELGRRITPDMAALPWRSELIAWLTRERGKGRSLILATGSDTRIAEQAAKHLQLFDLVLSSDGTTNLCGQAKRMRLVNLFGEKGFDYAADGGGVWRHDQAVWASARKAILVNPTDRGRSAASRAAEIDQVFTDTKPTLAARVHALRPAHWLKNLLVFVPLFAAHRFGETALLEKSALAFLAFGCCASGGYLFNDVIDIDADRHHPQKRFRQFASGSLSLSWALVMIPVLLSVGCILAMMASPALLATVLLYFAMSAGYTLYLKRVAILDVLFLAGLYTVRIMAGSTATGIWPSHWLVAFSIFLFFSLALVKRYSELVIMRRVDGDDAKARSYELGDSELLAAMGIGSGYLSVLVLALYVASDRAQTLYASREILWFVCPLLLYWVSHVWLTAHRGKMPGDPVEFATRDRTSRILILLMAATAAVAW